MGALPFRWNVATAFLLVATLVAAGVASAANPHVDAARITILQTTDLHDHANGIEHVGLDVDPVYGTGAIGSYARIAAYVEQVRAEAHWPVVLVDSGDWTMGTIYDLTLASNPLALNFLDRLRYDCVTLGNHEFDYTSAGLAQMLAAGQAAFDFHTPIVASNMNLNGDASLAPFTGDRGAIRPSFVKTVQGGLRVGYLGLMGRGAANYTVHLAAPVTFDDPPAHYAAIQALVNDLRTRADIVIVLSHSGTDPTGTSGEDVELARHVTGIDVIASGHTHTPLASAHAVTNGNWTTQIIDAGAFGSNVARIDLVYDGTTHTTTLLSSSNAAMSDASLATIAPSLASDPFYSRLVNETDFSLNGSSALLMPWFADYNPADLGLGIYHPVAVAAQDMAPDASGRLPPPNGLGDLVADALRAASNALLAQTLADAGGDPQNLPGYDFTPFQAGLVVNVSLRGKLLATVPSTFTDVYNVLPIGISPDPQQALRPGDPLISAYIDAADARKLCALQLVAQSNATLADSYLHLSGIGCALKPLETYVYFKFDTAAGVLQVTSQKAAAGSALAAAALGALAQLAIDHGAALLAARAAGNPYATAMVNLNDSNPDSTQIAANLAALGQVGAAAAADQANGTIQLVSLFIAKATAAVGTLNAFDTNDVENAGAASPWPDAQRVRFVLDLTTVGLLASAPARFGTTIATYRYPTGSETLSTANLPAVLASRIDADPSGSGVQELKGWMALLWYAQTVLEGEIGAEYASTANFAQFPAFGVAVKTRSASYPLASIGQYAATIGALLVAP
ncbi:MAG TPA: metallophosphoesterase [Rudaea sp.]|nr:metallophosphoesterase [Rudaea sp.]